MHLVSPMADPTHQLSNSLTPKTENFYSSFPGSSPHDVSPTGPHHGLSTLASPALPASSNTGGPLYVPTTHVHGSSLLPSGMPSFNSASVTPSYPSLTHDLPSYSGSSLGSLQSQYPSSLGSACWPGSPGAQQAPSHLGMYGGSAAYMGGGMQKAWGDYTQGLQTLQGQPGYTRGKHMSCTLSNCHPHLSQPYMHIQSM